MILDKIVERKKMRDAPLFHSFLTENTVLLSRPEPVDVLRRIRQEFFLICEVKRHSPSKGEMMKKFNHLALAEIYEQAGASAISVVTEEEFFHGVKNHLTEIRENVSLPLLRKDFIFHPAQVYESYNLGADMVLLIAGILEYSLLEELYTLTLELGMEPLVEIHTEEDLAKVLPLEPAVVGINNRNLKTFEVSLETSFKLRRLIPEHISVISESGIRTTEDIHRLKDAGFSGALVGEAILKSPDPAGKIRSMKND